MSLPPDILKAAVDAIEKNTAARFKGKYGKAAKWHAVVAATAVRDRVLALHKPVDRGWIMRCCAGCEAVNGEFHDDCCHEWPCPTVELLDGAP